MDDTKKCLHALITEATQQSEAASNVQRAASSGCMRARDGREKGKGIMKEDTGPRWMQRGAVAGSGSSDTAEDVDHDEDTQAAPKKPCVVITPPTVRGMTSVSSDL